MVDQPVKISEEPTTNTVQSTARIVVLYNANTTSPSVRTIEFEDVRKTFLANGPVYVDNAAAVANGEPTGAMYVTTSGDVRVVV